MLVIIFAIDIYIGKMCDVNYEIKSMKYTVFGGF